MAEDQTGGDWYNDRTATLGDRLAAAREASGFGEQDLAGRLGVEREELRTWEADTAEPLANKLSMLAELLDVTLPWLLTGRGEGVEPPMEALPLPEEAQTALNELRDLRAEAMRLAERTGLVERRLRLALKEIA